MINVKFYMYFNGERIRTLDDLRENFIAEDVLEAYSSGQLAKWLKVWRHQEELEQVEAIESENAREILRELVRIFAPDADAEEIDAELSVYDYLEERRKFREYMMTHGLDKLETLRRERDTLRQENDSLKRKLEDAKRKTTFNTTGGRGKRINIPIGSIKHSTWTVLIASSTACRITDVGNCKGKLLLATPDTYSRSIEAVCSNEIILQGFSVYLLPTKITEDLYFYYEEV